MVDLLGAGGHLDAGHGAERHQLAARGVDRQGGDVLGAEPVLLAPEHQVDLLSLELVAVDEGAVHQCVDRRADLPRRKPQVGGAHAVGEDAHFRIAEVEAGNRAGLGAGHGLGNLAEDPSSQPDEAVEIGPGDIYVDGAPAAGGALEEARLLHDGESPRHPVEDRPLDDRDQLARPRRVGRARSHEGRAAEGDEEHVGDRRSRQRFRLGTVRVRGRLPVGPQDVLDSLPDLDQLVEVVSGGRQDDAEDQVAVAGGQVFGLGQQGPGDAQRESDQPCDDPQAQYRAAADAEDAPGDEGPHPFAPGGQPAPALSVAAEDPVGQAGDDGDRHDQAEHHRAGDGDGDVAEELAGLVLDEDDRQEDGHRGQGAGQERPPDLRGPVQGRADAAFPPSAGGGRCSRGRRWRCR